MSDCKASCVCTSAARIIGVLGVAVVVLAILVKYAACQPTIGLCGIQIGGAHLMVGANTLLLLALLIRPQGNCTCKSSSCCDSEKGKSANQPTQEK